MGDAVRDLFLFIGLLVLLFILWAATGGPERAVKQPGVRGFETRSSNEISSPRSSGQTSLEEELRRAAREVDRVEERVQELLLESVASPYRDFISLSGGSPRERIVQDEYIRIRASSRTENPINITGWRIESVITGAFGTIPEATPLPVVGAVNVLSPLLLAPGDTALIHSGRSPLGISFRLNRCTGYLDQFQRFEPRLPRQCPNPEDEFEAFGNVPVTSIRSEDDEFQRCFDYVDRNIRRCEVVTSDLRARDRLGDFLIDPPLPNRCIAFIHEDLTYPGCVRNHRADTDFFDDEWRVYLGSFSELWREKKEVLRLLDREGRVVDVWQY